MLMLLNGIRRSKFFAALCVAWFSVSAIGPIKALSAPKKTVGQRIEFLVPQRVHGDYGDYWGRFDARPAAQSMGAGLELFGRRKDGTEFPVEIGTSAIQSPEGTLVLNVIGDVTERKEEGSGACVYFSLPVIEKVQER